MTSKKQHIHIYSDGGARGNPGPGAYGCIVYDENKSILFQEGKTLGVTTNNIAEYSGVKAALSWVSSHVPPESIGYITVFLDSELVTRQLSGIYQVKNEALKDYFIKIKQLEAKLMHTVSYTSIPREQNKEADRLVNLALDGKELS